MIQNDKRDLRLLYQPGDRVFYRAIALRQPTETYRSGTVIRITERLLFVKPDLPENERYLSGNSGMLRYPYIGAMRDVVKYTPENAKIVEELSAINELVTSSIEKELLLLKKLKGEQIDE